MRSVGDYIWYTQENCDEPIKGKIYNVFDHELIEEASYCMIRENMDTQAESRIDSECYDTKEDCEKAIKEKNKGKLEKLKREIKTKADIIKYIYKYFVKEDGRLNYTAREALEERAAELGVELYE